MLIIMALHSFEFRQVSGDWAGILIIIFLRFNSNEFFVNAPRTNQSSVKLTAFEISCLRRVDLIYYDFFLPSFSAEALKNYTSTFDT